jgi:hypothetical protein
MSITSVAVRGALATLVLLSLLVVAVSPVRAEDQDTMGYLKMRKLLGTNLYGATPSLGDFSFTVNDGTPITLSSEGTALIPMAPGSYTAREVEAKGYTVAYGAHCGADGSFTIAPGTTTYCSMTNNGIAPKITFIKEVVEPNGTFVDSNFTLRAGSLTLQDAVETEVTVGSYTLSEDGPEGSYTTLYSCDINGEEVVIDQNNPSITLGLGDEAVCVSISADLSNAVSGTVWNDVDSDGVIDESEALLAGWTVTITNGTTTISEITDNDGVFVFVVDPGAWTLTNESRDSWNRTFPQTGSYSFIVPTTLDYNFGVIQVSTTTGTSTCTENCGGGTSTTTTSTTGTTTDSNNGGGGGGGNGVRISLGDGNGGGGSSSEPDDRNPAGEVLGANDSNGGGTSGTNPAGEVKGAVAPLGAPHTGMGGMSETNLPVSAGMLLSLVLSGILGLGVRRFA